MDMANKIAKESVFGHFASASIPTKLSFLIMGFGNFAGKQIIKGLFFLIVEITFIIFMITSGADNIKNLITLGTKTQEWQFDKTVGFKVQVAGDNSMLLLVFGICTILIVLGFVYLWQLNIKSAVKLE